ncbi:MAG: hypothetical protein Q9223_007973, partial [Gallowayella weberi]
AVGHGIWDLINPSIKVKPISLLEPKAPVPKPNPTVEDKSNYKYDSNVYRTEYHKYKEQRESFARIVEKITNSISFSKHAFIKNVEKHPWDILRALKAHLAPSDEARLLTLEAEYSKLKAGPGNRQDVIKWVDDFAIMYAQARQRTPVWPK